MNLERFKIAQADPATGFDVAVAELRHGQKVSHWIWYVFPQLRGLGRSPTAQFYAIHGSQEARSYLRDASLQEHLITAMEVVAEKLSEETPIETLMGGSVDSLKLVSCMTLFASVTEHAGDFPEVPSIVRIHELAHRILKAADQQGYPECEQTLGLLR